ncbi:hypothetical protein pb186bvf_006575 [Paramecium bursaria]
MDDFSQEQKFLKKYFESIAQLNLEDLKKFLAYVKEKRKDSEDKEKSTIKYILNNTSEGKGKKAVHFAASRGDLEIFKYLEKRGADIHALDSENNNTLIIAVQHEKKHIVEYLVQKIDVNYKRNGVSALHLAAQTGNIPILHILLQSGADIDATSNHGTPIIFAAANKKNWCMSELLKKGANINIKFEYLPPLLFLLIDQNNEEALDIIFNEYSEKIDANIQDPQGWSVLQFAAEKGNSKVIEKLLQLGADANYQKENVTALDLAIQNNNLASASIIREVAVRKDFIPIQQGLIHSEEDQKRNLGEVLELKKQGNILLQNQQYQQALEIYQQALSESEQIQKQYGSDIATICTNMAQCYIKLKNPNEALKICKLSRQLNKQWIKTYYYEGQAYEQLEEYGEAAASYFEGLNIEGNPLFKQLFDDCKEKAQKKRK